MVYVVETQTSNWNWISFILGILIGAVVVILIAWLAYSQRWAYYSNCRIGNPICTRNDYYTLDEAFQNGYSATNILEVDSNGVLIYKRVPKNTECIPGSNQNKPVLYPQFCLANINGVDTTFTLTAEPSSINDLAVYKNGDTTFNARRHCNPDSSFVSSARPLPQHF